MYISSAGRSHCHRNLAIQRLECASKDLVTIVLGFRHLTGGGQDGVGIQARVTCRRMYTPKSADEIKDWGFRLVADWQANRHQ
jgi:hypothetical protein